MYDEELRGGSRSSGVISRSTNSTSSDSLAASSESEGFDDTTGWNAGMYADMEYHDLFEDAENDSGIYACMARDYDGTLRETQPDWRWILHWLTQCSATDVCAVAEPGHTATTETTPPPLPAQPANPPGSSLISMVESPDGQRWKLLESPATRRLKAGRCVGVLFHIDVAWNRKDVQQYVRSHAVLASLVEVDHLFVGYHFRDSAGLALALCDGADLADGRCRAELFLAALTNSGMSGGRFLNIESDEDLRPFYKVDRIKEGEGSTRAAAACVPAGLQKSVKAHTPLTLYAAMRDVLKLRNLISAHGGLGGCRFVAFDCEAAVVAKGSVALPVEFSFVDCLSEALLPWESACPPTMHIDPGVIDDEDSLTSKKLSTCGVPGGHGLPLRNYEFLRRDYTNMANDVHRLLFPPLPAERSGDPTRKTILINKGSTMDLQSIRWLYAVDAVTRGHLDDLEQFVPQPDDVAMFDVTCLQEALGVDLERDAHRRFGGAAVDPTLEASLASAREDVGRCWYHGTVAHVFPSAHCASKDARALAAVVGRWLL
jgi:hypothetical protein